MDPGLIAAALAFVAIAGIGLALSGAKQPAAAAKRVKAFAGARGVDRRKQAVDMATLKRKQSTQDALKALSLNEKESRRRRVSIQGQLAQAGLKTSPTAYWVMAGCAAFVCAFIGLLIYQWIGAAIGAFVGLLGLPRWVLGMIVSGRQKKFTNQLADAIDVIVRGVKSGLPLGQCLRIIGAESPEPLRTEFQLLCDAQAMGVPLDQSMQRMFERMPLPEVNFFGIVLTIQQKTGGNLSESLGNLSGVLRARKLMKEKVKALSSEAKASAMIIGSLPLVVMTLVYLTRPSYIGILFTDPRGHLVLIGAGTMMATGIFVMNKMVNFKF